MSRRWSNDRVYWVLSGAALGALSANAWAASIDWTNQSGDGNYNTALNWSTAAVPSGADDAAFVNAAAGPASISADIPVLRDIRFGDDNRTGSGVVNHSAGAANLNGWFRMGINTGSGGTYNLSGGTVDAGRYNIAESAGATGTMTITGGTLHQRDVSDITDGNQWNRIGQDGVATFNLSNNGTVSFDSRTIMSGSPTAGATVTQTGGVFEVRRGEFVIGDQQTATYNITGGTLRTLNPDNGNVDTSGHLTVGQWDNSNGTLNVGGTALVQVAASLQLADGQISAPNAGTVTQTGGTVQVGINGGNLALARLASGTATYNLSGGVLDLSGGNIVKGDGNATFNMTGGELRNVGSFNFPFIQAGGVFHAGAPNATSNTTITAPAGTTVAYSLGPTASLLIDLATSAQPGTGLSDVLRVNGGTTTLSGNLILHALGSIAPNTAYLILDADGTDPANLVGVFANAPQTIMADNGQMFSVNYHGGDGNAVVVTSLVPEPSMFFGAVGVALAGGLGLRRRRVR